jgi:hypothetical protein
MAITTESFTKFEEDYVRGISTYTLETDRFKAPIAVEGVQLAKLLEENTQLLAKCAEMEQLITEILADIGKNAKESGYFEVSNPLIDKMRFYDR